MPNNNPGENIQQQPNQKHPAGEVLSPPPASPDRQKAQRASGQDVQADIQEIEDRVRRAERWMIGLTFAIAAFALCAVIVGIFQWSSMSGQLREMRESNKINRDALVSVQRAFVFFTNTLDALSGGRDRKTGQKAWLVTPHYKNSGNTAALNVHVFVSTNSPEWTTLPGGYDFPDKVSTEGAFPNTNLKEAPSILASQFETGAAQVGIPDNILGRVNFGKSHVYLWGRVTYEDIFGCGHITRFCKEFTYRDPTGNGRLFWDDCGENTCADKTCKDYQPTNKAVCLEAQPN